MTRSFIGAVRLLVDGRYARSPSRSSLGTAPPLAPIDLEAWRRWAVDGRDDLLGRHSGDRCRLPDGEFGRVMEVFEGGSWRLACEPMGR